MKICTSDGNGNLSHDINNVNDLSSFIKAWSNDYGATWKGFSVGTTVGANKANGFFVFSSNVEEDSKDMVIRVVNRHNRCLDVHFYFTPDASPKIKAFAQNDAGLFEELWTLS